MRAASSKRMGQQFNWPAVTMALRVFFRQQSLLMPHLECAEFADIDFEALRAAGFVGMVLDKDNTLTLPYAMACAPRQGEALKVL